MCTVIPRRMAAAPAAEWVHLGWSQCIIPDGQVSNGSIVEAIVRAKVMSGGYSKEDGGGSRPTVVTQTAFWEDSRKILPVRVHIRPGAQHYSFGNSQRAAAGGGRARGCGRGGCHSTSLASVNVECIAGWGGEGGGQCAMTGCLGGLNRWRACGQDVVVAGHRRRRWQEAWK